MTHANTTSTAKAVPVNMPENRRILIVDDNDAIHSDFRKTLGGIIQPTTTGLDEAEAALFGDESSPTAMAPISFELDCAIQGEEGYAKVQKAADEGRPYSVAFVDMRMPPGWDGLQTIEHFWKKDPDLQV